MPVINFNKKFISMNNLRPKLTKDVLFLGVGFNWKKFSQYKEYIWQLNILEGNMAP
jgi:hypothetical protein